ncbi:glycogen-binding domain-containing protein [uncultured Algibacter sp.]|uniref:glycogen-binding domain-containing protein n=1 Tax=uncultured Algibacter sp. TaxID=298659 RepID=UPI002625D307|nr:glycogen-binding domain-containing protein [uncultured Algibacter sp.]
MKFGISHTLLIILTLLNFIVFAQSKTQKGYRIEGDTVVFSFKVKDYSKFTQEYSGQTLDFADFDIENVAVSGEFNLWSRDQWQMKKIDDYNYELRKSIYDFNDEFSWEFKYVINNSYWAEPSKHDPNVSKARKDGRRLHGIYNLKMYTAHPDKNGNAFFTLKDFKNAKQVILAGSFNKWDEDLFKMNKTESGWELTLKMKPDKYQYRFIVDGKWMADPTNPDRIENEYGEYNSVINIKVYTTFKLRGYLEAQRVILAGSFNDWNEQDLIMHKMDYGWKYVLPLSGGKHHYKFIVDGEWIVDPNNTVKEYDGKGHINSVCMVK